MAGSDIEREMAAIADLLAQGADAEADPRLAALLAETPGHAVGWRERAWIALRRGDVVAASEFAAEAFRLDPTDAGALSALAACALQSRLAPQAADLARLALQIAPEDPRATRILGLALSLQGRFAEALDALRPLKATPDLLVLRAKILSSAGAAQPALEAVEAALAQTPEDDEARLLCANLLQDLVRHGDALAVLRGVSPTSPHAARAQWLRGMSRVALGDWAGYVDMEARLEATTRFQPATLSQPVWRGRSDLTGRSILVHCEQGLGDTVQFCRFAPRLAARGAEVRMMVRPPLQRLLASLPGVSSLTTVGGPAPDADCRVSVMSLPGVLEIDEAALSPFEPYLAPDPELVTHWAARLATLDGGRPDRPRIGLVWSGGVHADNPETFAMNARRNVRLRRLAPLLRQDATFVGLQVGAEPEAEHAAFCAEQPDLAFANLGADLSDMADTAAVIRGLDLLISVDTSVVHVAGAIGAPVWMLNRRDSCWRWMQDRTDTPWYPSLTQFRQTGDSWDPVIATVAARLAAHLQTRPAGQSPINPLNDRISRHKD